MRAIAALALLFGSPAIADPGPWEVTLPVPVDESVNPDVYEELAHDLIGESPADATGVHVFAEDSSGRVRPLHELLASTTPVPIKDDERRGMPVDNPGRSTGFLSGKATYLSQAHGWLYDDNLGRWRLQRGLLFKTVEDYHNAEGINEILSAYLENAGASVYTVRERDANPNMAIADNDGTGFSESGSGFENGAAGWASQATYGYNTHPFDLGTTRRFPASGGGVATWIPTVPEDGYYAVYVSWDSDPDNASAAHYRITHKGGVIDRYFNQKVHGSTWQYVEKLWLEQGTSSLKIELVGDSTGGAWLSADAVRIGGGMDDVERAGKVTGQPRWESGAVPYIQFNGAPKSIYDPYSSGVGSDVSGRSKWAQWEHPTGEDAIYLSWHSNAGGGVGTSTYTWSNDWSGPDLATEGSWELGELVQDELINSFRTFWDSGWTSRGHRTANFGETNPSNNSEMPAALVELAFHDDEDDTWHLRHPQFRRDASRAMYRAIVKYFAERDGVQPTFLPEPPEEVSLRHNADGKLEASWKSGVSGDPFGDAAQSYVVFTSTDGRSWSNGTAVSGTRTTLSTSPGQDVYVRVAGVNDGGMSFPSEVVGARRSGSGEAAILVVSAFDRLDGGLLREESAPIGTVARYISYQTNPFDTAVATGRAIDGAGYPFDTVSDEVFNTLDLSSYDLVVWVAGEESTADESFSDDQQGKLRSFVQGGGSLWVSGSEILWDLDGKGSSSDKSFASEVLGATMASDNAGSSVVDGEGILSNVGAMDFGFDVGAPYPVEFPDELSSSRPVVARYGSGGVAGVVGDGVALFGFPFEAIADEAVRIAVAEALLPVLLPGYTPPDDPDDTGDTDEPDDTDDTDDPDDTDQGDPVGRWTPHRTSSLGCGCSSTGLGGGGLGLALAMLLVVRRRR